MENQSSPPPYAPPPAPLNQSDERMWAMITHLSALPGSFVLIGSVVAPLVIWQIQKERSAFVDYHGKEAVNFQITMALAALASFLLFFVLIGFVLIWVVGAVWLLFTVIAAVKANNGEYYRYPITIRFIK
ncbi:DUF4870 domain-containing protein [Spirosoma utsteinense]|uniref:Orotate phosphoribosyltransferase n=1 Tax=Spirosoma utsteinense TaxID=2585773 RepID=A0ABR6WAN2_9BACT|nr:DUF4870 domain-containing protein [Spirosoma utsteinense]MBC3787818.1 hypothetical protein [Spirosoma utsteinense]MBC3793605.1 hypothetical protein [Spirosoma utsteinense]